MQMPFGKHRGEEIIDLPDGYLEWLKSRDLREPLRPAVRAEWAARQIPAGPVQSMAARIVQSGYRGLAFELHPDRGGDTAQMQSLNAAAAWLRAHLRGLAA